MKSKSKGKLAIFDTFKTKEKILQEKQKDKEQSSQFLEVMLIQLNEQELEFLKK